MKFLQNRPIRENRILAGKLTAAQENIIYRDYVT